MMKILFACLLLVVLFANGYPQVLREETGYEMFRRQHIYGKMLTGKQCGRVISQREIYDNNNRCKETNTFIISEAANVKSICEVGGGTVDQNNGMTYSNTVFTIVRCNLKGGRRPNCEYEAKVLTNRIVGVRCAGRLPVHYQNDRVANNNG